MERSFIGSGGVLKKRSSSGCLIIKKKVENRNSVGASSGLHRNSNEKKNHRLLESDGDDHRKFNHQVLLNRSLEDDDADRPVSFARPRYEDKVGEVIRVQGKNGVLKIMVNKKRRVDLAPHLRYERTEVTEIGRSRSEDFVKLEGSSSPAMGGMLKDKDDKFEEESNVEYKKSRIDVRKSFKYKETGIHGRNASSKAVDLETDGNGTALKLGLPGVQVNEKKEMGEEGTPDENAQRLKRKDLTETKSKRVGSTEKQILREKIRGMLIDAGWKIDHRPRRNRDYLDAVYINPNGTAYWSIIKAYEALKKQLQENKASGKPDVGSPSVSALPEDLLNKLTRQTKKKVREELERKSKEDILNISGKRHGSGNDWESSDSHHKDEKLARSKTQIYKSGKTELKEKEKDRNDDKHLSQMMSAEVRAEKTSVASTSSVLQRRTSKTINKCTLQPRAIVRGLKAGPDGHLPYMAKRTILAWLIDSGTVHLSEKVQYMNHKRSRVMLEGWITRDGIHCGCCNKILTISKFELHAHSKARQPFQNIFLESGASLLNCQLDAWNKQGRSVISGFHDVTFDYNDPESDICCICGEGDGGDLIRCSNCLSTFHLLCLDIKTTTCDWKCGPCICKYCGDDVAEYADNELISCEFCLEKYHRSSCCTYTPQSSLNRLSFCRLKCQEMHNHLLKILGVKHELEAGFSWSLLQRAEVSEASNHTLPQRVECNSKLAVALSILDECFFPIFDQRSGINILRNVVYSIRSNLNRLNYQGFFTAVLEREDEIVSVACIRIHGTRVVEMPFVATREIYRRQGMCRRLLAAIEAELVHFGVEHLIMPALPKQESMWTGVFGFRKLEDALKKELKAMNILVFPEMHFLQKHQQLSYGIKQTESMPEHRGKASKTSYAPSVAMTSSTATASGSGSSSKSLSTDEEATRTMFQTGNNATVGLRESANSETSSDTEDADIEANPGDCSKEFEPGALSPF